MQTLKHNENLRIQHVFKVKLQREIFCLINYRQINLKIIKCHIFNYIAFSCKFVLVYVNVKHRPMKAGHITKYMPAPVFLMLNAFKRHSGLIVNQSGLFNLGS